MQKLAGHKYIVLLSHDACFVQYTSHKNAITRTGSWWLVPNVSTAQRAENSLKLEVVSSGLFLLALTTSSDGLGGEVFKRSRLPDPRAKHPVVHRGRPRRRVL